MNLLSISLKKIDFLNIITSFIVPALIFFKLEYNLQIIYFCDGIRKKNIVYVTRQLNTFAIPEQ